MTSGYSDEEKSDDEVEGGVDKNLVDSLRVPVEMEKERADPNSVMQTIAGVAGNILEWYDFAVFGYFGDVIGEVFLPPQKGNLATAESFIIFGCAFVMRPIGGMMMGYIGDTWGRKKALEISIFLMAFPTFTMGCLPSYKAVGFISPILLLITRLLQGLSVGGQMMSSLVFTVESRPRSQWGLYGSYVMAAANVGTLLGGIIGNVIRSNLNDEQLISYGWRIPFWMGLLVSFSGVYLKMYGNEVELHAHLPDGATPENPIIAAFRRENRRALLSASLVPMLWSGGFYLAFVWMVIYMLDLSDNPIENAFTVNNAALFISVVLGFPPAGALSDKLGRVRVMAIGGVCMLLFAPLLQRIIGMGHPWGAFLAQMALGTFLSFWCSPMMAWLVESFRPELRLTAVSIGYNMAQALIGGSFPSIATVMTGSLGNSSPGFLLSGVAVLGLVGLFIAPPSPILEHENVKQDDNLVLSDEIPEEDKDIERRELT